MMSNNVEEVDALIAWLKTFDPSRLNEDDVETKFVLPFFEYLGYSNKYRRGKYPINDNQSEQVKKGRKQEIDQIYFSEASREKQGPDTALVLIEAKKPQVRELELAIEQARRYARHLTPLFLVVTNASHLIILKRHGYRKEEIIFNDNVKALLDKTKALELCQQLQFTLVKELKEQGVDTLTHALYAEMLNTSRRYPDLQAQLSKGNFEPSITLEERRLTVIKSAVAITCELPFAFTRGSCTIKFSNIMLHGLTCHLTHTDIMRDLLYGLGTPSHWGTRRFLGQAKNSMYEANLGQTAVVLSEQEAKDLCSAIDDAFLKYKSNMVEAANILETWEFPLVSLDDTMFGCKLLSVEYWLWDLMKIFASEFDFAKGNTKWNMFDNRMVPIRLIHKQLREYCAVLNPSIDDEYISRNELDIVYNDIITELGYSDRDPSTKFKNVGPYGFWTATYTRSWIIQEFIPQVLAYYLGPQKHQEHIEKRLLAKVPPKFLSMRRQRANLTLQQVHNIMEEAVSDYYVEERVPLSDITHPKQFTWYIERIQPIFLVYGAKNISSQTLRAYYTAFIRLAHNIDPTQIELDYIQAKLSGIDDPLEKSDDFEKRFNSLKTYSDILYYLDEQVARINRVDYEHYGNADLLSRVFGTIVEDGVFHTISQHELNAAKSALQPLWEQCKFEDYFIKSIRFSY